MSRKREDMLKRYGINTDNYLALSIDRKLVPEGADIYVTVVDGKTGERRSIPATPKQKAREFARNSRFYGQIMEDGHIFNPYIHRRFIAAQFKRLYNHYGHTTIKASTARSRDWNYAIKVLRNEVHALANLYRKDDEAYHERARFFTMSACAEIIRDYAAAVARHIDDRARNLHKTDTVWLHDGNVKRANIGPMKFRFECLADAVRRCTSYEQIDELFVAFDWLKLPNEDYLPMTFVDPFIAAGAYFTLKHYMMHEGLRLDGKSQRDSLFALRHSYKPGDYLFLYSRIM